MALDCNFDVSEMFAARESQRSALHARYLNEQFVRVLKTIGYDVGFQKGQGQYLYDRAGDKYLDLLSGFGVFAVEPGAATQVSSVQKISKAAAN